MNIGIRADAPLAKWIDFFVLHKSITPGRINRRIKAANKMIAEIAGRDWA